MTIAHPAEWKLNCIEKQLCDLYTRDLKQMYFFIANGVIELIQVAQSVAVFITLHHKQSIWNPWLVL